MRRQASEIGGRHSFELVFHGTQVLEGLLEIGEGGFDGFVVEVALHALLHPSFGQGPHRDAPFGQSVHGRALVGHQREELLVLEILLQTRQSIGLAVHHGADQAGFGTDLFPQGVEFLLGHESIVLHRFPPRHSDFQGSGSLRSRSIFRKATIPTSRLQDLRVSFPTVNDIQPILDKALCGTRLSLEDVRDLLSSDDWTSMVRVGHALRNRRHNPSVATWTAFRVVNYTNFCNVDCSFCSFKDEIESSRGYTLTIEEIKAKTIEARDLGCDAIFFQGGVNPNLPLSYYTEAFQLIGHRYGMHVRALSPVELWRLAEKEGLSLEALLEILKRSGLGSVPGAGAEILTERMREVLSPKKLSAGQWCEAMGACHRAGLPGSCNIVFGSTETVNDVAEHLGYLRDQQDRTGGFLSFVPWVFQPQTKNFPIRHVQSWEYLRMVAVARMFLDNIPNIEVSIMVMGRELAELGLYAGANDISSIVIEENVLASRGLKTMRAAERYLTEAGFQPRRRTLGYELI